MELKHNEKRIQGLVFFRGSQMLEVEKQINEWISTVLNPNNGKILNTNYQILQSSSTHYITLTYELDDEKLGVKQNEI